MKKELSIVVFWGSLWGIFEATAGYVLHSLNFSFGWLIWYPAAYYFMNMVYKKTGKVYSVFLTSLFAAAIKLADFLLPVRLDQVLNPFSSILLEGLAVSTVLALSQYRKASILRSDLVKVLTASLAWRVLYLLYLLPLPDSFVKISPLRGVEPIVQFLFIQGLFGGIVIYIYLSASKFFKLFKRKDRKQQPGAFSHRASGLLEHIDLHPLLSFTLLFLAFLVQWMM